MTWDEFKKMVDDALEKAGKNGDVEIQYIDFSWPEYDRPSVFFEVLGGEDMMSIH